MVNKSNGLVKTRMDAKLARSLEDEGLIDLRPSVTEVASVADGFGAFSAGVQWVLSEAGKLYGAIRMNTSVMPEASVFKASLSDILTRARDLGSKLHDAFDRYKLNPLKKDEMEQDEITMVDLCGDYLDRNWAQGSIICKTEQQFCNRTYGGTTDIVIPSVVVVDWKTVGKKRKFKSSEVIQLVAYAIHWKVPEARLVMIEQSTLTIVNELILDQTKIMKLAETTMDCFKFHDDLKALAQVAGI